MCVYVFVGGLGVAGLSGGRHASWDGRRPAVDHAEHPNRRLVIHSFHWYFQVELYVSGRIRVFQLERVTVQQY